MVDVLFLIAFIALPVAAWRISSSLLFVSVWLGLGFGVAGNLVQGSVALGIPWNVRGLQILVVLVMAAVLGMAWWRRSRADSGSLVRQLVMIVVPALVIGGYLLAMRLLAPDSPGPLSAVGYLINHPQAEDNAKWLHLSAQLADGREIAFSGYAGGPLLLVMSVMAALISVLSLVLLGGVNEVAVAANTVVGTQFLLIALVPFAFAVFAEKKVPLGAALRSGGNSRNRAYVPAVLVWVSMLVVALASTIITSYGHLSLQFVFLVLVGWSTIFVMTPSRWLRLATTLTVVTTASVWLPMTAVAIVLGLLLLVWVIRARWWWGLGAVAITVVVAWDAMLSSALYLLGIDAVSIPVVGSVLSAASGDDGGELSGSGSGLNGEVIATAHLFRAPGATEVATPLLGGLAAVAVLAAVWMVSRRRAVGWKFAPLLILGGYAVSIAVMDSVTTASSPNYSLNKLLFAVVIVAIAAYLPLALMALDAPTVRMTALRWAGAGAVVLLLTVDTLLPRALSALSPLLWPSIDSSAPAYWSAAEVRDQGSQPLSSLPVACLFAPPISAAPTSLPLGQESYSCTRLLIGLNGLEGSMRGTPIFLQTDWLSQRSNWESLSELVAGDAAANPGRSVILMNPSGGLAGIAQLDEIVERN
jgi:hypothetical protein